MMENYEEVSLDVNLNDLPGNEDELDKHLSPAEKRSLKESKLSGDPRSLIENVLNKKDVPTMTVGHEELVATVRKTQWFQATLTSEQRAVVEQFLKELPCGKENLYTREDLLTIAKNLLLTVENK
eukprot:TRINITY_DN2984_c0_g4_i2.p1 TRINITY_DN2984_c0_g4~~TRINITY_DN2984_c0_g4_i2.p1  ORF type:complete len:125 (+),score=29.97 TRINITY_DN2984_c0_g4_i2:130-504(+)